MREYIRSLKAKQRSGYSQHLARILRPPQFLPDIGEHQTSSVRRRKLDKDLQLEVAGAAAGSQDSLEGAASLSRLASLSIEVDNPKQSRSKRSGDAATNAEVAGIWNKTKQRRPELQNTAGTKALRRAQRSQLSDLKQHLDNTITCLTPGQLSQSINYSTLVPQLTQDQSTERLGEEASPVGLASPIEVNFENFLRSAPKVKIIKSKYGRLN